MNEYIDRTGGVMVEVGQLLEVWFDDISGTHWGHSSMPLPLPASKFTRGFLFLVFIQIQVSQHPA